ncbi:MAG: ABC transporter ATP-binding protein [Chloroflexota bacterium]|nr:ABC transporter ATP-binding protein [Chloroflexota bacterium]
MTTVKDGAGSALRCVGIEKRYGSLSVVAGLDLHAERGELVALLGPSGCGKTTTLRLIAGFEQLDAGLIMVGERPVAEACPGRPARELPPERRRVGLVFQDYALFPHLSVRRNVAFGLPRGGDRERRADEALEMVGLDGLGDRMPAQLSGGQQQRVALARALAPRPDVVLLDEPFSNLDVELRAAVRAEVRQILADAGTTGVLVTHDQEEALSLADRVAVMWHGRIVQAAAPEELYHRPASREVAAFVGDAQFLPGEAAGGRVACALGDLPVIGSQGGAVDVVLRPESLRLRPIGTESDAGARGKVLSRQFYGHDQSLVVQLEGGVRLRVRAGPLMGVRPGDSVQVTVRGAVQVFPRAT